jgi:DNA end-binding protein Ku
MAEMIIDNLTSDFDPDVFHDQTREAIEAAARAKLEGEEVVSAAMPEPTKVLDLLEALKASVEATKRAS